MKQKQTKNFYTLVYIRKQQKPFLKSLFSCSDTKRNRNESYDGMTNKQKNDKKKQIEKQTD